MRKKLWYESNIFSLEVGSNSQRTILRMNMYTDEISTKAWPKTAEILRRRVPGVLKTRCFNEFNLPFREEVKQTELGHLFEHLVLEFACSLKIKAGYDSAKYAGRTFWNWEKDGWGTFWIYLDITSRERDFLVGAIARSVVVLGEIIESKGMLYKTTGNKLRLPVVV